MRKNVSFRVAVGGVEKELFCVLEKKNEGLTLIIRRLDLFSDDVSGSRRSPYIESKLSIHTSEQQPFSNAIHRTVISRDLPPQDTSVWTDAVKRKSGFTPIFWKLCSDMYLSHTPKPKTLPVHIGAYDPNHYSLCYCVLLGAPSTSFTFFKREQFSIPGGPIPFTYHLRDHHDFFVIEEVFTRFKLVVLVSYLTLPSIRGAEHVLFLRTFREDEAPAGYEDFNRNAVRGQSPQWCVRGFDIRREDLAQILINHPGTPPIARHTPYTFVAHPRLRT